MRLLRRVVVVSLAAAMAGCGDDQELRQELAVIESGVGGFGINITVPETVSAGGAAGVTITTYGNGCIRPGGDSVVDVEGLAALIVPHDLMLVGNGSATEPVLVCTDALHSLVRTVPVVFGEPGAATITVRGLSAVSFPADTIEVVFDIEVT